MTDIIDANEAGQLLAFAVAARPLTDGSEYGRLYTRYRTELGFRDLANGFAAGIGLSILAAPATGLVVSPIAGSIFDFRLSDLRAMEPDERVVFGLVHLGIAALAYPRDEDLDDAATPKIVTIDRVEKFMREAVKPLAAVEAEPGSIEAYAASAAKAYETMPPVLRTEKRGQRKKGCTTKVIEDVFALLVEQKMAREAARYGKDAFILLDRFRVGVAEIAGSDALETLKTVAQRHQAEA